MRKSKSVFLILSLLYVLIYILYIFHIVTIDDSIMLGLTSSAFCMSLSDVCNNILIYRITRNELGYICCFTGNVLKEYISSGITDTPLVNVINLKKNVDRLVPNYKEMIHPNKFYMSLNIFIEEKTGDYLEKKNNFINNTQIIIQSFSPEFTQSLNRSLFFEDDFEM